MTDTDYEVSPANLLNDLIADLFLADQLIVDAHPGVVAFSVAHEQWLYLSPDTARDLAAYLKHRGHITEGACKSIFEYADQANALEVS